MSLFDQFPHVSRYKLAVWPSPLKFETTIAGTPQRGDMALTLANPAGAPADVYPGYTLETDAAAGTTRPTVKTRIRRWLAAPSVVDVAENAIDWQFGSAARIFMEMQPWSVKPKIVVSEGEPKFYMDFNTVYGNQNQIVKPVVCMGPHHAGPPGSNVYYTSAGTFDVQGSALTSYQWYFEGGTPSSSTDAVPGWVHYTAAGNYVTRLTVMNAGGAPNTGYRFVNIGTHEGDWGIASIEGDINSGYTVKAWSRTDMEGKLRAGALVVIYGEETFGGVLCTESEATNRPETKFVGYIAKRTVRWNTRFARWDFDIVSLSIYADYLDVYDTSLQFRETTARWLWWKYYRLTADKGIIWHLMWHTNLLDIADIAITDDTLFTKATDIGRGGPFTAIRQFLASARPGGICSSIQGKTHVWWDPNIRELVDRPNVSWFTLTPTQYREEPYAVDEDPFGTSHVGAGGFMFTGATGTSVPILSAAPMEAADDYGKPQDYQGLILNPVTGQDGLNRISGHLYARDNNEYGDTNWPLVGNFRPFIDLVPVKRVLVNTVGTATDPLAWTNEVFYVKKISHKYDAATRMLLTDLGLSRETVGLPGVTVVIPEVEIPEEPPTPPPPPPPVIPPPPPAVNAREVWVGVVYFSGYGMMWSGDYFNTVDNQPGWNLVSGPVGASGTIYVHVSPSGNNAYWVCRVASGVLVYHTSTPKSPVWSAIATIGDSTPYGNLDSYFGVSSGAIAFSGESIMIGFHTNSGTGRVVGVHNGTSWTWYSAATIAGFDMDEVGPDYYAWNSKTPYGLRTFAGANLDYSGTAPSQMATSGGMQTGAIKTSDGKRLHLTASSGTEYVRNAGSGATVSIGSDGGHPEAATLQGAGNGPQAYAISAGGVLYLSDDGAAFSNIATWGQGYIADAIYAGGGHLVWALRTAPGSNVPTRLYARDGTGYDKQGNWWVLLPSTTTCYGLSLVF